MEEDGKKQIDYPKSSDGWVKTLFVWEGRALEKIRFPWALVTANAIMWTFVAEYMNVDDRTDIDFSSYESFFGLILSSSLAFLLVFRLNRSAERFWIARHSWGNIVAFCRTMVSGVLIHGRHDPTNRDAVVKWLVAFAVATMHFIRGIPEIVPETLAGVLNESEIKELEGVSHPGLHAADQIRWHLKEIFKIDDSTPFGVAQAWSQQLDTLEKQLNSLVLEMGAMERIRATPLPIVYVAHLRTFLLSFLLAMPYIWESALGYATIPVVFFSAWALLGLEGAAEEVESPFLKDRPNHLNMDAYCLMTMRDILQLIRQDADREIRQKPKCQEKAAIKTDVNSIEKNGGDEQ